LNGERAKLSRCGDWDRSIRRLTGRGGIFGILAAERFPLVEVFSCVRDGRGGTGGIVCVDMMSSLKDRGDIMGLACMLAFKECVRYAAAGKH